MTSSILNYQYENGRRYHAYRAGQYLLPNDETEQERLDIIHHIFTLTLGGEICQTKLDNPQSILDIGTGTGLWVGGSTASENIADLWYRLWKLESSTLLLR